MKLLKNMGHFLIIFAIFSLAKMALNIPQNKSLIKTVASRAIEAENELDVHMGVSKDSTIEEFVLLFGRSFKKLKPENQHKVSEALEFIGFCKYNIDAEKGLREYKTAKDLSLATMVKIYKLSKNLKVDMTLNHIVMLADELKKEQAQSWSDFKTISLAVNKAMSLVDKKRAPSEK